MFAANLGFPRIGAKRQLKTALESFWSGLSTEDDLVKAGKELRLEAWQFQEKAGLDFIPSNDFSFYDHVLDTIAMVGAVPKRFSWNAAQVDLSTYFLMARGALKSSANNGKLVEAPAMEMTKWFNTNYHFIVPELEDVHQFKLSSSKCLDQFLEAKAAGIVTRPVLLGPVTFLYLAKGHEIGKDDRRLQQLLEVYGELYSRLREAGAEWVQMDEPCLATDLNGRAVKAFETAYAKLSEQKLSIMLTSYFSAMAENLAVAQRLPVQGLHLDLVNGLEDLERALSQWPPHVLLSAGVIDGRNVWRCDLEQKAKLLERIREKIGEERLIVAPSCSLIHVPLDAELENRINPQVVQWLSFARQKVKEVSLLADALCCGPEEVAQIFRENSTVLVAGAQSSMRNNPIVKSRLAEISPAMCKRQSPFIKRKSLQQAKFALPLLPTTTIGSFPQTKAIREARKNLRQKLISQPDYEKAMKSEIENNISLQEKIGFDVFVHGEPERTDMVEYFAHMLDGVAVSQHGWVQSYGSRYVKPPIIFGDVLRLQAMTVEWAKFAQSLTTKPVKGMLTGPVTMLQWSFVRDDQPREVTCKQLALAIRDEVTDLEAAGIKIIQIDEPAIREGMPLRRAQWQDYIDWSVQCFCLASSGVADDTQIHTHMCYSEFGDMVQAIADMDADVISIEAARSSMDLLDALREIEYPNDIGPGVWDIHSPRVPAQEEIEWLLRKALKVIPADRLWVNPDCGLKTRSWNEVIPALNALVQAAQQLRHAMVESLKAAR